MGDVRFFPDFPALERRMEGLGLFRMTPGTERVREVARRLRRTPMPYVAVQVAGTNGKGSTCVMLARIAEEHGLKTGLHISPHFLSLRERLSVNGIPLPEDAWLDAADRVMAAGGADLSWFEFITCISSEAFASAGVDLAVMESGLGGRWDAVTALEADMVIFTPIDMDHEDVLGSTLRDIAADKAGAVRPGKAVLSGPQSPEALEELRRSAAVRNASFILVEDSTPLPFPPDAHNSLAMPGKHQFANARLALAAFRTLTKNRIFPSAVMERLAVVPPRNAEARALARARLPGRMQMVPPLPAASLGQDEAGLFPAGRPPLLLDGAHNAHGLAALGESLAASGTAPAAVIFSCLRDKNIAGMLPLLRALATGPIFIPPIRGNPRAADPEELAVCTGLNASAAPSLDEALRRASVAVVGRLPESPGGGAPANPLLICGSLYLLGEFYALCPEHLRLLTAI
ncbi:MAG: bifunctional folylpolyglutamate synthase/dihydrofolate synthase [Desulfovibrio sp.]|jgi:dihydrofolate synthase/folylpolyglutamate synthase|nr:bifunctional folylpolyglutamate synthase/dihydrofolate synthase [Desulfovibrio sp.]